MHSEQSIRFGEFELHPRTHELQRNGDRFLMQEQPFQVLLILLERPGDLITREELTKRLWPADTFVDFEHSLNKAVKRLREVLGDSADSPRFIETLPRQGYRFIGPVEHVASGSLVDPRGGTSELEVVPANSIESPRRLAALAACAVLLAAASATYYFATRSKASAAAAKVTQISQWNKTMNGTCLSPDGHSVVFAAPVGGIPQLFVMLTSGGEPLQVTNDAGDKAPLSFSPDGTEIYFENDTEFEVWTVPTLGGSPRRVVSGYQAVPSSDGAFIFYRKVDKPGIFRADKSGLNEEMIYNSDDTELFPILTFSGDNNLLVAGYNGLADFHLSRLNLTSRELIDLGQVNSTDVALAWAEPGNSVPLARTVNGLTNIWKYDLRNRGLTQITFGPGADYSPMPDPGGKGIYFVNSKSSGVLTAYSVQSKESREIESEAVYEPTISPDGKRVMYIANPADRRTSLWVADVDGKNKLRIASGEDVEAGTWTSDNTWLSYVEMGNRAEAKAYIVRADGNGLRQIPGIGHTLTLNPVWSPNQKSVYFSALENYEKLPSVWKWGLESSSPQELVDKCGVVVDVDPGERYLLATTIGTWSAGIYEVSISDGKCVSLIPGVKTARLWFARDGKSILYATITGGESLIFRQGWNDGKLIGTPQVALKAPFSMDYGLYDFSRDLSTIVYARSSGHADLYLLSRK